MAEPVYRPGTIKTYSGIYVDPLNMTVDDIRLGDIAHALARMGRYNGHYPVFRSVGQHSLEVGTKAWRLTGDRKMARTALGHDFSEAYMGDMVNPMKRQPEMKTFVDREEELQAVIAEAFDLYWPFPELIHELDQENGEMERDLWNQGRTYIQGRENSAVVSLNVEATFRYFSKEATCTHQQ